MRRKCCFPLPQALASLHDRTQLQAGGLPVRRPAHGLQRPGSAHGVAKPHGLLQLDMDSNGERDGGTGARLSVPPARGGALHLGPLPAQPGADRCHRLLGAALALRRHHTLADASHPHPRRSKRAGTFARLAQVAWTLTPRCPTRSALRTCGHRCPVFRLRQYLHGTSPLRLSERLLAPRPPPAPPSPCCGAPMTCAGSRHNAAVRNNVYKCCNVDAAAAWSLRTSPAIECGSEPEITIQPATHTVFNGEAPALVPWLQPLPPWRYCVCGCVCVTCVSHCSRLQLCRIPSLFRMALQ